MKNHGAVFLVTAAGLLAAIGGGYGLSTITAAPTVRYEEVADWPALPAGVQTYDAEGRDGQVCQNRRRKGCYLLLEDSRKNSVEYLIQSS
jgi:hypothetical protein